MRLPRRGFLGAVLATLTGGVLGKKLDPMSFTFTTWWWETGGPKSTVMPMLTEEMLIKSMLECRARHDLMKRSTLPRVTWPDQS